MSAKLEAIKARIAAKKANSQGNIESLQETKKDVTTKPKNNFAGNYSVSTSSKPIVDNAGINPPKLTLQEKLALAREAAKKNREAKVVITKQHNDSSSTPATPKTPTTPTTNSPDNLTQVKKREELQKKLAEIRAKKKAPQIPSAPIATPAPAAPTQPTLDKKVGINLPNKIAEQVEVLTGGALRGKEDISFDFLNEEQKQAVKLGKEGQSFCLIGAAGSGKTTTTKITIEELVNSGLVPKIQTGTKWLKVGKDAISIVSFTNVAVGNIREVAPENIKQNCLTIHKLLEFAPVWHEVADPKSPHGTKKTMRYEPKRNQYNPIPDLKVVIVEEAGTVPIDLWDQLISALPKECMFIFLGDLNQIPPVFGDAILGFKLLELPVVELSRVYRTDTDSPILALAHKILEGKPLLDKELKAMEVPGELEFVPFAEQVNPDFAHGQLGKHFYQLTKNGEFNPGEDVVLLPYGKPGTVGAWETSLHIAQARNEINQEKVYEIITGFQKRYFAAGDHVYHAKARWKVLSIEQNAEYLGKAPQPPSLTLDRWGNNPDATEDDFYEELSAEDLFNKLAETDINNETNFRSASHVMKLECLEDDVEELDRIKEIREVGDFNDCLLSYALTVHKSQGSEWKRVFCVFHNSHRKLNREILYTAITRARKFLRIYYHGDTTKLPKGSKQNLGASIFRRAIIRQAIPGKGLKDKLEYFRKKLKMQLMKVHTQAAKNKGEKPTFRYNFSDAELAKGIDAILEYRRAVKSGAELDFSLEDDNSDD